MREEAYDGAHTFVGGLLVHFVRVGTLNPEGARAIPEYYRASEIRSAESLERRGALRRAAERSWLRLPPATEFRRCTLTLRWWKSTWPRPLPREMRAKPSQR